MKQLFPPRVLLAVLLIFGAAATRFLPFHIPNVTAIAAIALFSGTIFRNKVLAFIVPLSALFLGDLIIGFHETMLSVYACFAFTVCLGMLATDGNRKVSIATSSLLSSLVFYIITNFDVWYGGTFYSQDLNGLMTSYYAALPFFRNELLGDLFYNAVLFGGFHVARAGFPSLRVIEK